MCKKYSTLRLVFTTLYTNDSYTSMIFDPPFLHNFPIKSLSYTFKSVTRVPDFIYFISVYITGNPNLVISRDCVCQIPSVATNGEQLQIKHSLFH